MPRGPRPGMPRPGPAIMYGFIMPAGGKEEWVESLREQEGGEDEKEAGANIMEVEHMQVTSAGGGTEG